MNLVTAAAVVGLSAVVMAPVRPARSLTGPSERRPTEPATLLSWWRRRSGADPAGSLPLLLELLARELRSGATIPAALTAVAAHTPEARSLRPVVERVAQGGSLATELDRWAGRYPGQDGAVLGAVLQVGLRTGAALADALDRAAATLRARRAFDDEVRALTAQSRMSALLLAVAPVGFFVVFSTFDRSGLGVLLGTPVGWGCLAAGLVLDGLGFLWMRSLTRSVVDR